jgi:DNA-binding GntR family transcriptional regulator
MPKGVQNLRVTKRRVLADEVTDDLRDAIVAHELETGRRLGEDELAEQMGVSRGPVREALMRLEREGLITIERHRGARVSSWGRKDIDEIYSMRGALEELAIQWACKNATKADLAEMTRSLKEFSKLSVKQRTPKEVSRIDLEFHTALFLAAHHNRLFESWKILRAQIHTFVGHAWSQHDSVNITYLSEWESNHQKLLDVIISGKTQLATELVREHVEGGHQRVFQHFPAL